MLDSSLKENLKGIFAELKANYQFNIKIDPQHESRDELVDLLNDMASCSEKITCEINSGDALFFSIKKDGQETGISFRAVPNGHEFTSLILAVLNADGKGKNFPDEFTSKRIKALKGDIKLTTYMSLTCTNCPDVVQALNIMTLLNNNISHEAVDGAINQDEVERLGIKSVPTVYANGEPLHIGRSTIGELVDKLEAKFDSAEIEQGEPMKYDIIVAGGGPAGATAAVYSARKGLNVAVVAERIGGQVNETVAIENLITVAHTTGKELATDLKSLLKNNGIAVYENRTIEHFGVENGLKTLSLKGGEVLNAPQIIIATGAQWRKLNIEGESEYIGRGVAFCPHCDGPLFKNKHVAVIGGGNSGIEAAIDLAGICSKVTVIEFLEELKADKVLQEKARSINNISIITNTTTQQIVGDGNAVTSLVCQNRASNEQSTVTLDGVFVQIGLMANSGVFKDTLETNRIGEIVIKENGRTALQGVYAAGDVTTVSYKQIVISMGEGAKAALAAFDDRIRGEM